MGGELRVQSKPKIGSAFHFSVVLEKGESLPSRNVDPELPKVFGQLPKLSILVADDNPVNLLLAQRMLEKQGHSVTPANDGLKAFDCFERGIFDLVLLDIQMPEMTGEEVLVKIRQHAKGSVPIIALTAHAVIGERERLIELGMDGYVSKPMSSRELSSEMSRVLGGASERRSP
jgi:CheY-like chemotaxis protein